MMQISGNPRRMQTGHAVGSSVSPTTTSASYSDMADMSVTLTTIGGDLAVWFDATFTISATGQAGVVGLSLDGAAEVAERLFQETDTGGYAPFGIVHRFTGVAAGSHTVKVRWYVNGGATLTAYSRARSLLVQEQER